MGFCCRRLSHTAALPTSIAPKPANGAADTAAQAVAHLKWGKCAEVQPPGSTCTTSAPLPAADFEAWRAQQIAVIAPNGGGTSSQYRSL